MDVKNAFNIANWAFIRRMLMRMNTPFYLLRIIGSYFSNRKLLYECDKGTKLYSVSDGVLQGFWGSCCGT